MKTEKTLKLQLIRLGVLMLKVKDGLWKVEHGSNLLFIFIFLLYKTLAQQPCVAKCFDNWVEFISSVCHLFLVTCLYPFLRFSVFKLLLKKHTVLFFDVALQCPVKTHFNTSPQKILCVLQSPEGKSSF